jgi:hypothetical protein
LLVIDSSIVHDVKTLFQPRAVMDIMSLLIENWEVLRDEVGGVSGPINVVLRKSDDFNGDQILLK